MATLDLTALSDAHEDSTGNNFSDSAAVVTCTAHTAPATPNRVYYGGFEFVLTAEIPAGATIDVAYITVQANALAPDDANNRMDLDFVVASFDFGAITDDGLDITDLLLCYDPDSTGGDDTTIIPIGCYDFEIAIDGSSVVANHNAAGVYRAAA